MVEAGVEDGGEMRCFKLNEKRADASETEMVETEECWELFPAILKTSEF
jgi:hypothetical protein